MNDIIKNTEYNILATFFLNESEKPTKNKDQIMVKNQGGKKDSSTKPIFLVNILVAQSIPINGTIVNSTK